MNKIAGVILFVFFYSCPQHTIAQDCKELLVRYLKKMSPDTIQPAGKGSRLDISLRYTLWNSKDVVPNVQASIVTVGNTFFYDSDPLSVYSDANDVFVVNKSSKQIIRNQNKNSEARSKMVKELSSKFQSALLDDGVVSMCVDTTFSGRRYRLIEIKTSSTVEKSMSLTRVRYLIDYKEDRIFNAVLYYNKASKVRYYDISYKLLDYNYSETRPLKVSRIFLGPHKRLNSTYNSYSLIDNR